MPFVVIYDASVLYPNTLRDLLLRIARVDRLPERQEIVVDGYDIRRQVRRDVTPCLGGAAGARHERDRAHGGHGTCP